MGLKFDAHAGEEGADRLAVGDDVGHVGLESDDHHVVHKMDRFLAGDALIGCLEGRLGLGNIGPLGLALEAFLDLADSGEVFVEFFLVAFTESALHAAAVDTDEVENALALLKSGIEFGLGVARVGEEGSVEIEGFIDARNGVAGVIPGEGEAFSVSGVGAAIDFLGREDEGRKTGVLAEVLSHNLVTGDGVVKALARSSGDVGSGEVGRGAAVRVGCTEVGEIGHHGDVVLVPSEGRESLGHADLGKATGFLGVESVLGEAEAAAKKNHALGRSGRGSLGVGEAFQEGKCQNGAAETKKGSAGGGVGMERHRVREFSREAEVTVLA